MEVHTKIAMVTIQNGLGETQFHCPKCKEVIVREAFVIRVVIDTVTYLLCRANTMRTCCDGGVGVPVYFKSPEHAAVLQAEIASLLMRSRNIDTVRFVDADVFDQKTTALH